jgi:oligopeptide/dipeptide ABC transporter ATP-binding protein
MDRVMTVPATSTSATTTTPVTTDPRARDGEVLVELRDISVQYRVRKGMTQEKVEILAADRVSLTIHRGRTLGLVGGTGSGKSTIAHVIMGMVEPTGGSLTIAGHELKSLRGDELRTLRRVVQVVLQDPYSSLDPRMKVGQIIAEPLTLGSPFLSRGRKAEVAERVAELLRLVRLPQARAESYPHQFSGGQRQRIAVARALAPRPELIVLDEPTSALDVSVRAQILTLLRSIQDELGVAYLVISHDLVTVAYLATTVAVMHLGRIVEIGPTKSLYQTPGHPYTLELLSSAPGAGGAFLTRPRPADRSAASLPPTACRFAYRCALRTYLGDPERCLEEDPALTPVAADNPEHSVACHFPDRVAAFAIETEEVASAAARAAAAGPVESEIPLTEEPGLSVDDEEAPLTDEV